MTDSDRGGAMHDRAVELLEGYVLGALDPAETALVDQHLEDGCADCDQELGVLRRVGQLLPLAARGVAPAVSLRERVLAAVARPDAAPAPPSTVPPSTVPPSATPPSAPSGWGRFAGGPRHWSGLQAVAAGLSVVAVAGLLSWAVLLQGNVDDLEQRAAVAEADANLARAIVSATSAERGLVRFNPMSDGEGSATLVWDPDTEWFALAVTGMPPTHDDDAYVCWADTPAGAVPLAHVYVRDNGTALVEGTTNLQLADVARMRITHENDAEADRPDGAVVFTFDR